MEAPASTQTPTPSSNTPPTVNDHDLILGTSISGGVVLLAFVVFVAWRLSQGHHIADILKLRRKQPRQYAIDDDRNPFAEMGDIQKTQRYSVRSHRFPHRLSVYSTKGNKARTKSSKHSSIATKGPMGYTSDWQLPSPKPVKTNPNLVTDKPVPQIMAAQIHISQDQDSKISISRSDLAETASSLPAPDAGNTTSTSAIKAMSTRSTARNDSKVKRKASNRIQKPPPPLLRTHVAATHTPQPEHDPRFSLASNPDCPPTPKYKLERTDSGNGLPARTRMEPIEETSPRASQLTSKTSFSERRYNPRPQVESVATLSAIIRNYAKPVSPVGDVEMGFGTDESK